MKIFKNKLFWITISAFFVRFIYGIILDKNALATDASEWNQIALNILNGNGFSSNYRGPLYPIFLSSIYSIFGYSVYAVRIIQSVIGALTCLTAYFIGKKIFNKNIGLLSAAISAFYPYFIYYSADIMAETMITFLLSLSILTLFKCYEEMNIKNSILYGVSAGVVLLCKGTFLPFYILSVCWLFFANQDKTSFEKIKNIFIILIFIFLTLSPWALRNYNRYNKFVLLGLGGQSLWLANNPESIKLETLPEMNLNKIPDSFTWYDEKKYIEILKLPPVEADKWFKQEAIKFIKSNPLNFAELCVKRFFHFWRLYPLIASIKNKIAAIFTSGILLPLGWAGILLSLNLHFRKTLFLILLLFSTSIIHSIFLATIRYRIPIDLYIIIFASYTINEIYLKLNKYRQDKKDIKTI